MTITYHWGTEFPHFRPSEIFSPETRAYPHLLDFDSMESLELFRRELGIPLLINHGALRLRGVRSDMEQARLRHQTPNAALHSMHVRGKAFDLSSPELTVSELYEKCVAFGWPFVKKYSSFVHVDNRDRYSLS